MWGVNYCMEGNYKHRVVDALLERKLLGKGAVLVEGAANLKSLAEKIDTTRMLAIALLS